MEIKNNKEEVPFGHYLQRFRQMDPGDAGFEFAVVQDYRIRICVWEADEEFPAQIRLLWDKNSLQFMHFETLYYVMGTFLGKLLRYFLQADVSRDEK